MKRYIYDLMTDQRHDVLSQISKFILLVLSYAFAALTRIRNYLFDQKVLTVHTVDRPVISVGNITMGGVGKTPLVVQIAQYIKKQGFTPAVLIRGYMEDKTAVKSDEAMLIKAQLPDIDVLEGGDRYQSVQRHLEKKSCDVFIMDDGFQHRRLHRDLDIVAIDSTNPFGNRKLIPRGILRESLTALKRANSVVLTRTDVCDASLEQLHQDIHVYNPKISVFDSQHRPTHFKSLDGAKSFELDHLRNKRVLAFCGIGNPEAFKSTLNQLHIDVAEFLVYIDHHSYVVDDLNKIIQLAQQNKLEYIVTTQKDIVKVRELNMRVPEVVKIIYLDISLKLIQNQEAFYAQVDHILQR